MSISIVNSSAVIQTPQAQAPAPKAQGPKTETAPKLAGDEAKISSAKKGFGTHLLTFGGGTLAGGIAGGASGAAIGALVGGNYAGTGASIGLILGGGAGLVTGLAVNAVNAARGEHSLAWGVGLGAAVGAVSSLAVPALSGGGFSANPLMMGIFGVIGAASGAAASYTAIKANQ